MEGKESNENHLITISIVVDANDWTEFKRKYGRKSSQRIREFMRTDLEQRSSEQAVRRDDVQRLMSLVFADGRPIQLVGDVGIGKTSAVKNLIKHDKDHVYIVLDCHDEYELPEIQTITTDLNQSCRIKMPKQVSASRGLYPVYHNQILSRKYPESYVVVVEEAHRYPQIKELLKEARKFVKIIAVCQEPFGSFCPIVRVIK